MGCHGDIVTQEVHTQWARFNYNIAESVAHWIALQAMTRAWISKGEDEEKKARTRKNLKIRSRRSCKKALRFFRFAAKVRLLVLSSIKAQRWKPHFIALAPKEWWQPASSNRNSDRANKIIYRSTNYQRRKERRDTRVSLLHLRLSSTSRASHSLSHSTILDKM